MMELWLLSIRSVVSAAEKNNFYLNTHMWLAATVLDSAGVGETSYSHVKLSSLKYSTYKF